MKKVYFAALLSITMMTANAQEPNIPMFGNQQTSTKSARASPKVPFSSSSTSLHQ